MNIEEILKLESEIKREIAERRNRSARWWLGHVKFALQHGIEISDRAQSYLSGGYHHG